MFIGKAFHQIDAKGRIRLPAKFKEELGANPVVMQMPNKSLRVYPKSKAEEILNDLMQRVDFADELGGLAQSTFSSRCEVAEVDTQGRIMLARNHIEVAELTKEVAVVGVVDHLEIWDKSRWDELNNGVDMADMLKVFRRQG